jgi:tRNA-specific 2-thiouridylase
VSCSDSTPPIEYGASAGVPIEPCIAWPEKGDKARVVVAMSGGVDSSVALALLSEQGYDVVGVMAHFWAECAPGGEAAANKCCSPASEAVARQVSTRVGAPFYVVDMEEAFHSLVVKPFIAEYLRGRTPNPCITCNRDVKFGLLLAYALAQGAEFLATGHYARGEKIRDEYRLLKGRDVQKDQSYMLYTLTQAQLARTLFPLGDLTKASARKLASNLGLAAAERPESQEICFVWDNDYRRFLTEQSPDAIEPGPIYDSAGVRLGTHRGLPFYTIGQREGLGIAYAEPLYVREIRAEENALIVGTARELGRDHLVAARTHFVSGRLPAFPVRVRAKIRYRAKEAPATIERVEGDRAWVAFDEPLRDITPGQAVVFYEGDALLGGGIIEA